MNGTSITAREYSRFQAFIHENAGIRLPDNKQALVMGRLARRLRHHCLHSYDEYFQLLGSKAVPGEVQIAIDLLTTNETSFFREPAHFDYLRKLASAAKGRQLPFRVWSAASSSGEEAYSIAMVLADCLGDGGWEVIGSDISTRVLETARKGRYAMARAGRIPPPYLKHFCLRGLGEQEGTMLVSPEIRSRVHFAQVNLNRPLPSVGSFDVIFLRNVMIYFDGSTKRQVVARVTSRLRTGGHLFIGHSENLNGVYDEVDAIQPAIYCRR
jgi:chemotaxis protein methyltransferase CheR